MPNTPTKRLADVLVGGIDTFIGERRPSKSWNRIALDLRDTTNGEIEVTGETVRNWATKEDVA